MVVVTAGVPNKDGCPVLTRLKAFLVDQGTQAVLQHTLRQRSGQPLDLRPVFGPWSPGSLSFSSDPWTGEPGRILLRLREWFGGAAGTHEPGRIYETVGWALDESRGLVRAAVPEVVANSPGIYELSWAVEDADRKLIHVERGLLSVEPTLFGEDRHRPPTLQEIRMRLMDSAPAENFLLDDVEFGDEQLLMALLWPVERWNVTPPPVETFTTRTFPFRDAWIVGALSQLYLIAAAHYRRNALASSGGGVQVNDKAKEDVYLREGLRLQQEYLHWMAAKKIELNHRRFFGTIHSPYWRL